MTKRQKNRVIEIMQASRMSDDPDWKTAIAEIEKAFATPDPPEPEIDRWTMTDASEVEALAPEVGDIVEAWDESDPFRQMEVGILTTKHDDVTFYRYVVNQTGFRYARRFILPIRWKMLRKDKRATVWASGFVASTDWEWQVGDENGIGDRVVAVIRRPKS